MLSAAPSGKALDSVPVSPGFGLGLVGWSCVYTFLATLFVAGRAESATLRICKSILIRVYSPVHIYILSIEPIYIYIYRG